MNRLTASILLASAAVTPAVGFNAAPAQAQSATQARQDIVLSIGKGQLINVPGSMADVFVADEKVADVQVKSRNQLYVFGKAGGETTVYASNAGGDIVWSANIRVGSNIDSIDQMLNLAMPEAKISVATMGSNTVLLTGTVAAPEDAAEAQRLVQAFTGEKFNVISRLRMATPLQVNLQVRIAEVRRELVREIGTNLLTRDQTGGFLFGASRGVPGGIKGGDLSGTQVEIDPCAFYEIACVSRPIPFDPIKGEFVTQKTTYDFLSNASAATRLSFAGKLLGLDLLSGLDLAERMGLVTTLSQPNLTALSGETADFLAGGEFPIPLSQGLGTITVEYKKYGVSLAYTPTVLANGRISLRVRPEVSELSSQGAITLNGFQVPALTTRRAETTVELGSGQSFMIAGLLSNNAQHALEKTPGVGDLPIVGNLFRSKNFRKGETELVIIVTPYLVNPVNGNDIKLPTDGYRTATEIQDTFLYMENDGVSGAKRPMPTARDVQSASPTVSQAAPAQSPAKPGDAPGGRKRRAEAVAPGFSFNPKGK